jgi:hypothetical protein
MYYTYITYTHYGQVHQDLGLADHVWLDKWAAIAKTDFKQLMTWAISFVLPCAQACFPTSVTDNTTPAAGLPVGQGTLVLPD